MQKLTERQRAVLAFITSSIDAQGYPPTLREIGNKLGIRSTNGVNDHLRALERKGYLTREDMKSRTLRPTDSAYAELDLDGDGGGKGIGAVSRGPTPIGARGLAKAGGNGADEDLIEIPIMGRVAAGALRDAFEQPEDTVRIDRMLVGRGNDVFGLRISGDSMIEAGIHDGDYVFVRKQLTANRGDIIVALVGSEATCKYYFPERDHVRLEPANRTMAPILVPKSDLRSNQILGVVVGVYRRLK
jgi:repressor LexA